MKSCFNLPELKGRGVMETLFDTTSIPKAKRFSAWQDALCGNYVTVDASLDDPDTYFGYIKYADFGGVQLSETTGPSQKVVRRRGHLARIEKDCFYLQVLAKGAIGVRQRGHEMMTNAGTIGLYYASEPYELDCVGVTQARFLQIPREALAAHVGEDEMPLTKGIDALSGVGRVLANFCHTLAEQSSSLTPQERAGFEREMLALTAMAIKAPPRDISQTSQAHREVRLNAIKRFIRARATDPMLSVPRIARAHDISERYLHDLFASSDTTVNAWLWTCRLEGAWNALVNAQPGTKITTIAYENGFSSSSHFSAAFRRAYGMTPREVIGSGLRSH